MSEDNQTWDSEGHMNTFKSCCCSMSNVECPISDPGSAHVSKCEPAE